MPQSAEVTSFAAKYEPQIAAQLQAVRQYLATRFPRGFELVYDNYNALACGFSPTDRAGDVVVSVAAYPRWVTLFFLKGATLPDPDKVLQGSGAQVRSVRLQPPEVLQSPPVQQLLALVVRQSEPAFESAPPLKTVIKSVSAKQKPRRPAPSGKTSGRATNRAARREA